MNAEELKSLRAMQEVTGSMQLKKFPDEVWDQYWEHTYNRLERNFGWILISVGAIVLLTAGACELLRVLFTDSTTPWWIRAATGLVAAGLSVLFVSVLRERIFVRKTDPYREVKR